ncbi:hypothetical protein QQ045_004408 [Rhodiola kirilowii]
MSVAADSPIHSSSSEDFAAFLDGELDTESYEEREIKSVKRRKLLIPSNCSDLRGPMPVCAHHPKRALKKHNECAHHPRRALKKHRSIVPLGFPDLASSLVVLLLRIPAAAALPLGGAPRDKAILLELVVRELEITEIRSN